MESDSWSPIIYIHTVNCKEHSHRTILIQQSRTNDTIRYKSHTHTAHRVSLCYTAPSSGRICPIFGISPRRLCTGVVCQVVFDSGADSGVQGDVLAAVEVAGPHSQPHLYHGLIILPHSCEAWGLVMSFGWELWVGCSACVLVSCMA